MFSILLNKPPREEPRAELEIFEPHRLLGDVAAVVVAHEYHRRAATRFHELLRIVSASARDVDRRQAQCLAAFVQVAAQARIEDGWVGHGEFAELELHVAARSDLARLA